MKTVIIVVGILFCMCSCSIQEDVSTDKVKVEKTREAAIKVNATKEKGYYSK